MMSQSHKYQLLTQELAYKIRNLLNLKNRLIEENALATPNRTNTINGSYFLVSIRIVFDLLELLIEANTLATPRRLNSVHNVVDIMGI